MQSADDLFMGMGDLMDTKVGILMEKMRFMDNMA